MVCPEKLPAPLDGSARAMSAPVAFAGSKFCDAHSVGRQLRECPAGMPMIAHPKAETILSQKKKTTI